VVLGNEFANTNVQENRDYQRAPDDPQKPQRGFHAAILPQTVMNATGKQLVFRIRNPPLRMCARKPLNEPTVLVSEGTAFSRRRWS
jgi:hypothetical protein